jgi:hypothetical protein
MAVDEVLYYEDGDVRITNRSVVVGLRFHETAALRAPRKTMAPPNPGVPLAIGITVIEAALIIPLLNVLRTPLAWAVAVAVLALSAAVAVFLGRLPRRYQVIADYHGREVILFSSRDHRKFGRMARALSLALERAPGEMVTADEIVSSVAEATDDLNAVLNLLGPPPESLRSTARTSPQQPVGIS